MADDLDVLTIEEGRAAIGLAATNTSKDTLLVPKITAVSRRLDRACGPIVRRDVTGEVLPGGQPSVRVRQWPVFSFTTVTEYSAGVPQVLTVEDFDTQPEEGYSPERWDTPTAVYNGRLWRRCSGGRGWFPEGPEAVKITYVAGRAVDTESVDPLFKDAAAVMLKNAWRPHETAIQDLGEFDVPAQNFPRFGIPNYVRDMLESEWVEIPSVA